MLDAGDGSIMCVNDDDTEKERVVFRRTVRAYKLHMKEKWITVTSSQHISLCSFAALPTSLVMLLVKSRC